MLLRKLLATVLAAAVSIGSAAVAGAQPPSDESSSPGFLVGAAKREITPEGIVNQGGFGLGDGSVLPDELVGRGNQGQAEGERLFARAFVVDNGTDVLAFVITENIGMFAAYQEGPGLIDMAESVAAAAETEGRIPAEHVFAAGNHSHSGPDTIGAWGGVDPSYLQYVHDQAVAATIEAYQTRRPAELTVGAADGRQTFPGSQGTYDLIDNQVCLEVASNNFEGDNNSCIPRQEMVDSDVRVLQATSLEEPSSPGAIHSNRGCDGPGNHAGRVCTSGEVIASFVTYAAHPTLGGAGGLHGDWPEHVALAIEATYGGTAVVWPGTIGRVQPERNWRDRRADFNNAMLTMIGEALAGGESVTDTQIAASKTLIRSEVTNVGLALLLMEGARVGAPIMRSQEEPWMLGNTINTVSSAARIGDVAFMGVPGEAYPQIALEAADSIQGEKTLFTLGLSDDMLGYLISHTEDYPIIAALSPVLDNALFNITPRIGDHVMCSGIRMAGDVGFETALHPRCPTFDAEDALTGSDF